MLLSRVSKLLRQPGLAAIRIRRVKNHTASKARAKSSSKVQAPRKVKAEMAS